MKNTRYCPFTMLMPEIETNSPAGALVAVGGTLVAVGGTLVAVGGTDVFVAGTLVAGTFVGGTLVLVEVGRGVLVGVPGPVVDVGTGVSVGSGVGEGVPGPTVTVGVRGRAVAVASTDA